MCRALRVLCAAPTAEGLAALRRAAVGAVWELVGGATSLDELSLQIVQLEPDVVVIDAALGEGATAAARRGRPGARIVCVGPGAAVDTASGADARVTDLEQVRSAVLGLPLPGGPVRR